MGSPLLHLQGENCILILPFYQGVRDRTEILSRVLGCSQGRYSEEAGVLSGTDSLKAPCDGNRVS